MLLNFFIIFCVLLFFIISIYTLIIVFLKKDIFDFRSFVKELNRYSLVPLTLLLLITIGILSLFLNFTSKSEFYKNSITEITNNNGLSALGDFFNGLITPIISIVSIIYIYKAFVQQYRANEMLYKFEYTKNIKEDLNWLRDNSGFLKNLELNINNKNINELEILLEQEITNLNKLYYTLNTFKNIFDNINENDIETKENTQLILKSFYLKSYKSIFRDFNDFMKNFSELDSNYYNDSTKIEIEFAEIFIKLYKYIQPFDLDKAFIYTVIEVKNNITNGKQ